MNFRQIEVFFAVMTCGTVTEAARQLGVSQPSVTSTIQQAESRLGIPLFRRDGGRLVPTAEARTLFEEAERAHDALTAFRSLARKLQIGQGGHVRIAAVPSISLELLPDAIALFQKRHKGFNYSVSTLNTEEMLQELDSRKGTFHLGFSYGNMEDTGIASQVMGSAELLAVFPSDWKIPQGEAIDLVKLAPLPYISGFDYTPSGQLCRNLFADAGVEPQAVARIHTHHLAGRLVQRGLGYTILDSVTVHALLQDDPDHQVLVRRISGNPEIPVTAIFPGQRSLSNPAKRFVDCFEEVYKSVIDAIEESPPW